MSIFQAAAVKINNILGITSKGQATKANSLPVALASDDDLITAVGATADAKVDTDAAGSVSGKLRGMVSRMVELIALLPASIGRKTMAQSLGVTLASDDDLVAVAGAAADAKVDTDAAGTISGKLRGMVSRFVELIALLPASIGQKAKAASLAVTLASDEDALPITDNGGSLTMDSTQLPAALGQTVMANSLAVTMASNQSAVPTKPDYTYGVIYEGSKASGDTDDWYAVRNANDVEATDQLVLAATIADYFNGADAQFDNAVFWVKIPVQAAGYREFMAHIRNNLDQNLAIVAYACSANAPYGATPSYAVSSGVDFAQIYSGTINSGGNMADFGNGGSTANNICNWPVGWLVLKITPAGDPTSGNWVLAVQRAS
jgi:hypothetical protein